MVIFNIVDRDNAINLINPPLPGQFIKNSLSYGEFYEEF
jgi:hypothetical protein